MDEAWIHQWTPETKQQSNKLNARREPTAKTNKTVGWKSLSSGFWDAKGLLLVDYV